MCERARACALVQASCACVLMAAVLPLMHWRTERNFAALSPENQVQPTNKTGGHMLTQSCTDTQTGRRKNRPRSSRSSRAREMMEPSRPGRTTADGFGSSELRLGEDSLSSQQLRPSDRLLRNSWRAEERELLQRLVCATPDHH